MMAGSVFIKVNQYEYRNTSINISHECYSVPFCGKKQKSECYILGSNGRGFWPFGNSFCLFIKTTRR